MVLPLRVRRPDNQDPAPRALALPGVGSAFGRPKPKGAAPATGARRLLSEVADARAATQRVASPPPVRIVSPVRFAPACVSPTARVVSPPPLRGVDALSRSPRTLRIVSPEPIEDKRRVRWSPEPVTRPAPRRVVELWFVRHGETVANASRITQGQQPGRLTRNGALQAAALGARLREDHAQRPFDVVLCSDLLRCRQTCHLATEGMDVAFARTDPLLRERAVGIYEGLAHNAPRRPRPAHVPARKHRVEGGESWEDVNKRARKLLARLGHTFVEPAPASSPEDRLRVLVVTHGGYIMECMNAATGADGVSVPFCANGAWNTSIWKVELTRNSLGKLCCRVVAANDASHLNERRGSAAGVDLRDDAVPACAGAVPDTWWADEP